MRIPFAELGPRDSLWLIGLRPTPGPHDCIKAGRRVETVHIDRDTPGFTSQPFSMVQDHNIGEGFGHAEQFFGSHGVFKAGQCWLRPGARSLDWIAVKQELLDRIVGQGVGIIAVRVAGGDAIYALPKKIKAAMNNFAGLSRVANRCIDTLGQGQLVIDSFQENGATIGTVVGLVKGNSSGFVKFVAPDREVFF